MLWLHMCNLLASRMLFKSESSSREWGCFGGIFHPVQTQKQRCFDAFLVPDSPSYIFRGFWLLASQSSLGEFKSKVNSGFGCWCNHRTSHWTKGVKRISLVIRTKNSIVQYRWAECTYVDWLTLTIEISIFLNYCTILFLVRRTKEIRFTPLVQCDVLWSMSF